MLKRIKGYVLDIYELIRKPYMSTLPGNLAFFFVLSLIPLITIILLILSIFNISVDSLISLIERFTPSDVSNILTSFISGKGFDGSVGFFNLVALVIAANGMYAITSVSDVLYDVKKSSEINKRIKSFILLLIIVALFVFLLLVPIFGNQILEFMKSNNFLSYIMSEVIFVFNLVKWPLSFLIVYFNIKLIYTISPSEKIKSENTSIGAFFTTILWIIVTSIFTYYLKYFARYDILYGNLSSIIILMMWMYLLAYVFVLGMAINANRYHNLLKKDHTKN